MDTDLVIAISIGLLVFGALYLALDTVFPRRDQSTRRAKALISGAGFLLVTLFLREDPTLLQEISGELVLALVAVVVALLALLRAALRRR